MKKINTWTCPKCNRQFLKQNQSHSCKIFPLEKHFEGKDRGRVLYEELKHKSEKRIGYFNIQSLKCCIHFDNISTFAAVKIFKHKIQVEFSLSCKITNERITKIVGLSANKYLHFTTIVDIKEIDMELMEWIKQAYSNTQATFFAQSSNKYPVKAQIP